MIVIDQERRMVMARGTRYSQEFKEDAVRYRLEHPEIALRKCAENLGISESALSIYLFITDYENSRNL